MQTLPAHAFWSLLLAAAALHCTSAVMINQATLNGGAYTNTYLVQRYGMLPSGSVAISIPEGFPIGTKVYTTAYVCENGYVTFGLARCSAKSPNSDVKTLAPVVAPYWSDLDLRASVLTNDSLAAGTGITVTWLSKSILTSSGTAYQSLIQTLQSALSNAQNGNGSLPFSCSVANCSYPFTNILIATWTNVTPFSWMYYRASGEMASFQTIVATDGMNSFAFFLFASGALQWNVATSQQLQRQLFIGFVVEQPFQVAQLIATPAAFRPDAVPGNAGNGMWAVNLTVPVPASNASAMPNSRLSCSALIANGVVSNFSAAPVQLCPCTLTQAQFDGAYHMVTFSSTAVSYMTCFAPTNGLWNATTANGLQAFTIASLCCFHSSTGLLLTWFDSQMVNDLLNLSPTQLQPTVTLANFLPSPPGKMPIAQIAFRQCCQQYFTTGRGTATWWYQYVDTCNSFMQLMPRTWCKLPSSQYTPPLLSTIFGAGNVISLSANVFTFNGYGEFSLFTASAVSLIQARFTPVTSSDLTTIGSLLGSMTNVTNSSTLIRSVAICSPVVATILEIDLQATAGPSIIVNKTQQIMITSLSPAVELSGLKMAVYLTQPGTLVVKTPEGLGITLQFNLGSTFFNSITLSVSSVGSVRVNSLSLLGGLVMVDFSLLALGGTMTDQNLYAFAVANVAVPQNTSLFSYVFDALNSYSAVNQQQTTFRPIFYDAVKQNINASWLYQSLVVAPNQIYATILAQYVANCAAVLQTASNAAAGSIACCSLDALRLQSSMLVLSDVQSILQQYTQFASIQSAVYTYLDTSSWLQPTSLGANVFNSLSVALASPSNTLNSVPGASFVPSLTTESSSAFQLTVFANGSSSLSLSSTGASLVSLLSTSFMRNLVPRCWVLVTMVSGSNKMSVGLVQVSVTSCACSGCSTCSKTGTASWITDTLSLYPCQCTQTNGYYGLLCEQAPFTPASCSPGYFIATDSQSAASCSYNCLLCPTGTYNFDQYHCSALDYCTQNALSVSNGTASPLCSQSNTACRSTFGGYQCMCTQSNYLLNVTTQQCVPVNACSSQYLNNCSATQQCVASGTGYSCSCLSGYAFNSTLGNCVSVNFCASPAICPPYSTCANVPGSYTCACLNGFYSTTAINSSSVQQCIDFNECANPLWNSCQHLCTNTPGNYTCSCYPGYQLAADGRSCNSQISNTILQAIVYSFNTSVNNVTTYTTLLSASCNSLQCSQLCMIYNSSVNPVQYTCSCNPGYDMQSDGRTCLAHAYCNSSLQTCGTFCTAGQPVGFICSCMSGYSIAADSRTCVDVNECATSNVSCYRDPNGICVNTIGSYYCTCANGLSWNSATLQCTTVDLCANVACPSSQSCSSVGGTAQCVCSVGFVSSSSTTSTSPCIAANYTAGLQFTLPGETFWPTYAISTTAAYQQKLTFIQSAVSAIYARSFPNTFASVQIVSFTSGSVIVQTAINFAAPSSAGTNQLNEMSLLNAATIQNTFINSLSCTGYANSICINSLGPVVLSSVTTPLIDVCSSTNPCPSPTYSCQNVYGSYKCSCAAGYLQTGTTVVNGIAIDVCSDFNECPFLCPDTLFPGTVCQNLPGTYTCQCSGSYTQTWNQSGNIIQNWLTSAVHISHVVALNNMSATLSVPSSLAVVANSIVQLNLPGNVPSCVNLCATSYCQNGGTCVYRSTGDALCYCGPQFAGMYCELWNPAYAQMRTNVIIIAALFSIVILSLVGWLICCWASHRHARTSLSEIPMSTSSDSNNGVQAKIIMRSRNLFSASTTDPNDYATPSGNGSGAVAVTNGAYEAEAIEEQKFQ